LRISAGTDTWPLSVTVVVFFSWFTTANMTITSCKVQDVSCSGSTPTLNQGFRNFRHKPTLPKNLIEKKGPYPAVSAIHGGVSHFLAAVPDGNS
jgi:hypothetical protein